VPRFVYDWELWNEDARKSHNGWVYYIFIMIWHKRNLKIQPKDQVPTSGSSESDDSEDSDDQNDEVND